MNLFVAPLQGYTESAWRKFHAEVYGPVATSYFSPFIRMEKGEVRWHDLRDIMSAENSGCPVVPQIIFRDVDEFSRLVDAVTEMDYRKIDLNLGCPFPLQTRKGRGAALLQRPEVLQEVAAVMDGLPDVGFSVKMRLGLDSPDEWHGIIDVINNMPLRHITVHPRTAKEGYAGELHFREFADILDRSEHPVTFNGGLYTPADCAGIAEQFPSVAGLMIGRGILSRPSLPAEIAGGCGVWAAEKRMSHLRQFHKHLFDYAVNRYQGDSQILPKLKPFWEYLEPEVGRKAVKAIRKAGTVEKYRVAVEMAVS